MWRAFPALAATAGLVTACGAGEQSPPSVASSSPAAVQDDSSSGSPVPEQLQFSATTLDGTRFEGASLAGRPAVLWFWAPWCPTCQREAPIIGQAAADNPDVRFVGVASLDEHPAMQEFVDRYPVGGFVHLADVDGSVWTRFGVTAQPAYAFVDADGAVLVVRGTLTETELDRRISALTGA
ncbi:protein disulfide oxidoreductase [Mycobacterium sp. Y57]|uniref:protein disulfide oxidoreductase n=1 Tax=Mycolicibacterium xanthum TaxID=2796469 RepID=UPI001C856CBD|nr:protein disulfide oxidoreductase [Mycolicibacterium xanthum]MBX7430868.1 protein disulfide oxidoreductase [Mycolicibacterium xanthum]